MPQRTEKTEPDAPPNCAVVPKKMRAMFTLRHRRKGSSDRARLAAPAMSVLRRAPQTIPGAKPPVCSAAFPSGFALGKAAERTVDARTFHARFPYFSASVSSPNHSGRWKSGRKWTMGAQEPKWGWIVSSHL